MAPHTETDTMRSCILLFVSQRMFSGAVASSIGTQWPGQARRAIQAAGRLLCGWAVVNAGAALVGRRLITDWSRARREQ